MTVAVAVLLFLLALRFSASTVLDVLNMRNVHAHADCVPTAFKGFMDEATYSKGMNYFLDKTRFGILENVCATLFLAVVLVLWVLPRLYDFGLDIFGISVWGQALTLIFMALVLSLPDIPFELYGQFVIEQEYGFNKGTLGLWVADKLKSFAVALVLGVPILTLIICFSETFKDTWWLWGFAAVAVFQTAMLVLYPRIIIPLFNKLEDLPEGETKRVLSELSERGGFKAKGIQVIDGSRRSLHSNAYFTGFGKFRRIVLFDTLLDQLAIPELEAVLAHEIGHYKKGHMAKMMFVNFSTVFIAFALMGYFSKSEWFYVDFGFSEAEGFGPVLLMFSMFSGLFTFWLSPFLNAFSRRNEYEADAFSADLCGGGGALVSALRKLNKKNLVNLTPHKIYSAFYYSHPTLLEREEALERIRK